MEGITLVHYQILRKLGEGGMGEVYLAKDTKLKRQVALKVLPKALRHDPERLRRFRVEAEAAAKLNHPNIATIYSVEEAQIEGEREKREQVLFITMEYVEGETLKVLIPRSGLDLDTFFNWFIPLVDALCHAHEHGVIHRDIKPGNIMVDADNRPKILDFGLAHISRPQADVIDSQASTQSLSQPGVILGTPAYMSPEQAEGSTVDARSDIFSFGVVMYEALTRRWPFPGKASLGVIEALLNEEPIAITHYKPELPYHLTRIVKKCLQKDRRRRYQLMLELYNDLGELRDELAGRLAEPKGGLLSWGADLVGLLSARRWVLMGLVVLLVGFSSLATWQVVEQRRVAVEFPLRQFQISLSGFIPPGDGPAISPDGTMIAYTQGGALWIRDLAQGETREMPGTTGAVSPFWSPGSDFVGYFVAQGTEGELRKVAVQGGRSTTLCLVPGQVAGASWGQQGRILVGTGSGGLYEVSDEGGRPRLVLQPEVQREEAGFFTPHFLEDGLGVLFAIARTDNSWEIVLQRGQNRITIRQSVDDFIGFPVFCPSGHILYQRGLAGHTEIWAVAFSPATLEVIDEPFLVAPNGAIPRVSRDGTLLYKAGSGEGGQRLVWVNRQGGWRGPQVPSRSRSCIRRFHPMPGGWRSPPWTTAITTSGFTTWSGVVSCD